jgi:hypothetical protein
MKTKSGFAGIDEHPDENADSPEVGNSKMNIKIGET